MIKDPYAINSNDTHIKYVRAKLNTNEVKTK